MKMNKNHQVKTNEYLHLINVYTSDGLFTWTKSYKTVQLTGEEQERLNRVCIFF
jgi:hypothetical protein